MMRIRYLSYLSLGIAAAFLVVATQGFALAVTAALALGVGIGMLLVSVGIAARYHDHIPSLATGLAAAIVSAWMIVASRVFSAGVVEKLTFAEALAIAGLAIVGLTAHERSTERVVHSLEVGVSEHEPERSREPVAA